jgi:AcrR family transcriptional regulator
MEETTNESGWRGSREGWLDAASEALLEAGVDSVKILPLAKKLGLSRTSFYWFFKDREELLQSLVGRWREKNTGSLVQKTLAPALTPAEAMLNICDCWLDSRLFDSKMEFAIRSWALQSDDISADVRKADQERLDALRQMFVRFGLSEVNADVRARTTYLVQIGYITMQTEEDIETRMQRIPDYIEVLTGTTATQAELQRFAARHGYRPV